MIGIPSLAKEKAGTLGRQICDAATSCMSTSTATVNTGAIKLHVAVEEGDETTLPRIELEVSVPYHQSREDHLLPLINTIATMTGQQYSKLRVVLTGNDGGPRMYLALRSNYPRE